MHIMLMRSQSCEDSYCLGAKKGGRKRKRHEREAVKGCEFFPHKAEALN